MSSSPTDFVFFWFRRDLRLFDNTGLAMALKSGYKVKPVFIFDTDILKKLENPHDRRVSFIYKKLEEIKVQLQDKGSDLWIYYGKPEVVWQDILKENPGARDIYTNRDYEPYAKERDQKIRDLCNKYHIGFHTFKDQVIFEQNEVVKDDGLPYTVYTPYSKKWKSLFNMEMTISSGSELCTEMLFSGNAPDAPTLSEMGFEKVEFVTPEEHVSESLMKKYSVTRDIPSIIGTSRLGLHLRFGTISIRQLVKQGIETSEKYLNELIWREFYQQILWHFPHVQHKAFKPAYDRIEWRNDPVEFEKWCNGETGYPLVDAGMRELAATGYMHNRVRMVVASFLTKHLLIDWRWGEGWFARHLLDFDLASNNGGWQWAAGSGVDAAPYFRVFNPTLQTLKFDPQFIYIRKWVPEFDTFKYPKPMVDHDFARKRCLEAYQKAVGKLSA